MDCKTNSNSPASEQLALSERSMQRNGLNTLARSQAGLTLVEIIVVLVILTILLAFLTGGLFSQGEKAKAQINGLRMKKLQNSINQYQLMYNQLPGDLQALVSCSGEGGSQAPAGCVPITEEDALKDAWGTTFVYSNDGRTYSIKSLGADRREGGSGAEGDVTISGP